MEHWSGTVVASLALLLKPRSVACDAFISPCESPHEKQLGTSGSFLGDTFAINCRKTNNVSLHTPSLQPEDNININPVRECTRQDISI